MNCDDGDGFYNHILLYFSHLILVRKIKRAGIEPNTHSTVTNDDDDDV
jgi:hypothetical protein